MDCEPPCSAGATPRGSQRNETRAYEPNRRVVGVRDISRERAHASTGTGNLHELVAEPPAGAGKRENVRFGRMIPGKYLPVKPPIHIRMAPADQGVVDNHLYPLQCHG